MGFFGDIVGGLIGRREERKANDRAIREYRRQDRIDRRRYLEDRRNEREYNRNITADERAYVAIEGDRQRKLEAAEWNRQHRVYRNDMNTDQAASDRRAEATAASRGIDLAKMREQAIAAGFNPLSVMQAGGMSAYSTEVGYRDVGANGVASGGGVSSFASGGGYSGAGYQSNGAPPVLSSGSFLGDAAARGLDTFFNTPPANDPLADALRAAVSYGDAMQQVRAADPNPKGGFGYDLTKVQPFRARVSANLPPLAAASSKENAMRTASASGAAPSAPSIWIGGKEYKGKPGWSDAADVEDMYAGAAGEAFGGVRALNDIMHVARTGAATAPPKFSTGPNAAGRKLRRAWQGYRERRRDSRRTQKNTGPR